MSITSPITSGRDRLDSPFIGRTVPESGVSGVWGLSRAIHDCLPSLLRVRGEGGAEREGEDYFLLRDHGADRRGSSLICDTASRVDSGTRPIWWPTVLPR